MLRKESEIVPEGNGPVPQQDEFGSGQPTLVDALRKIKEALEVCHRKFDKMEEYVDDLRSVGQHVARLEPGARQPRLAMEADGPANTKTRERTESAATAVRAMHGHSCTAPRIQNRPTSNSTNFGMMAEPLDLPYREDVLVENGDASPKSCLLSLEMRTTTAAGGLLPTGKTPTATETTFNEPPPQFYSTKDANYRRLRLHTSCTAAASGTCLLPLPTEGSSRQNQEKIERSIQAVLKVVSPPARFWGGGARCFVVRLCVLEQLDKTAATFGGSMIRDSKAFRRAVRAKYLCRTYSGRFAGSSKLGRL